MLLLNIGNTHTQIAESDGSTIGVIRCVPTASLTAAVIGGRTAAVASVVPEAAARFEGSGAFFLKREMAAACGLDLSLVDASTLGMDRLANAIELRSRHLPAAALDAGTAITLEYVDADGRFRGGAIAPGRRLMRRSLAAGTAQLPDLPLLDTMPGSPGTDTRSSIGFGIDRGVIGMVRSWLETIPEAAVYAVGGDAAFFLKAMPDLIDGGDDFTLRGLLKAWQCCH